jgi:hypothetical protein
MALKWWQQALFFQIYPRSFAEPLRGDQHLPLTGLTAAPFEIIIAKLAQGM